MTRLGFSDRVAVVTGAGRGIGRAHAQLLAARGARVIVNDLGVDVRGDDPSPDAADEVVQAIRCDGGEAVADHSSVASLEGTRALIDRAMAAYGRVDVLVHNAGRNIGDVESMLDVHVRAGFWLTDGVWAGMAERNFGRIVLTTSAAGLYGDGTGPGPNPKQPYATAKAAVIGLTRSLAMRGRPVDIRVNAISPGPIDGTEGVRRLIAPGPEARAFAEARVPLGRLGTLDDIGNLALFLASRYASYISGAIVPCDGGGSFDSVKPALEAAGRAAHSQGA